MPWNWPLNQITHKVAPALATGCTMVLKPSEVAPFSGQIFAEILDAARVPAGVFNLVHGDGPGVGGRSRATRTWTWCPSPVPPGPESRWLRTLRQRSSVFTRNWAARTRTSSSTTMTFPDMSRVECARSMMNSGQSCDAPTRMLVPTSRMAEALAIAKQTAELITVGDPTGDATLGPVVSSTQWSKINGLIKRGIEEGATLVTGGQTGRRGSTEATSSSPRCSATSATT